MKTIRQTIKAVAFCATVGFAAVAEAAPISDIDWSDYTPVADSLVETDSRLRGSSSSPSVSSVSVQVVSPADQLKFSYTVKNAYWMTLLLYKDKSSLDAGRPFAKYESEDPKYVSNGKHSFTFSIRAIVNLSAAEIARTYPTAYARIVAGRYDDYGETATDVKDVPVSFVSAASDFALQTYGKKHKLTGICRDASGDPCGTYQIDVGAINKKTGVVKVTLTATPFGDGKKFKDSMSNVVDEHNELNVEFMGQSFGVMPVQIGGDSRSLWVRGYGSKFTLDPDAVLGGAFGKDELSFGVNTFGTDDYFEPMGDNFAAVKVKNGTKLSVADESVYSKLKISYKANKGTFEGSFKAYVGRLLPFESISKSDKLYTVKFKGVVVDQKGVGTATVTVGSKKYTGSVFLD